METWSIGFEWVSLIQLSTSTVELHLNIEAKPQNSKAPKKEIIERVNILNEKIRKVKTWSNFEFTDEEKANPLKLYDELQMAGLLEKIKNVLPEYWDYNYAYGLVDAKSGFIGWLNRVAAGLPEYIDQLKKQIEELPEEIKDKLPKLD